MKPVLTIALIVLANTCYAQFQRFSDQLYFKRFNTDHGLSQASVNTILLDSKGFMWFGTDDGLNRYDGNQFKIYRARPDDSTTLAGNTIQVLLEDPNATIWVGTTEGLSRYNRNLERFENLKLPDTDFYSCYDLFFDKESQRLWIAAGIDGVYYIEKGSDKIKKVELPGTQLLNILRLRQKDNKLFLGTMDNGLVTIDLKAGNIRLISRSLAKNNSTHFNPVRSLAEQGDYIWVGTEGDGLKRYNTATGEFRTFTAKNNEVSSDKILSLAMDGDNLWVGTDGGGLTLLNTKTGKSRAYKHSYYNNRSISSNTIRSLLFDKKGDLWLGAFNAGVNYLPNFTIKFHTFRKDPDNPQSLPYNAILSFCELQDGTILIGSDGGGLFSLKNGSFSAYNLPGGVASPSVILSIRETSQGDILLGTHRDGLYRVTPKKSVVRMTYDPEDPETISSNIVWDIEQDEGGNIWIATEMGVNRIEPGSWTVTSYRNTTPADNMKLFSNDYTQTILIDSTQTLWVGHYGYLKSFELKSGKLSEYFSGNSEREIPNKLILSLHENPVHPGKIWFSAFGSGLVTFDRATSTFSIAGEKEGLKNPLILGMESDRRGKIWLTTNSGLVLYDPANKTFVSFEKDFGIDTAPFKDNATAATSSGYLLFGGTNGFLAFWPSDVNFQKNNLNVILTSFQLMNNEVAIDNTILKKSITEETQIYLPYEQAKFLRFEFSVPNFLSPSTIQYQYMLEGFDNTWQRVDSKRVSFTGLQPATYTLRVKAGLPSGVWGRETLLTIHVVPPWWLTGWARVGGFIVLLGLGYSFYRYRTYSLNMRKAELESIVAEQNQEIRSKNLELESQNKELSRHNEELLSNRNTISTQNRMLFQAQEQLKEINQSLEHLVHQRTEKLNDTILRLNKTIKELDAFLYSASHDLVSPLKSILGLCNLAKLETSDESIIAYFDHIERSVKKLEGVIRTLMQHSFNTKANLQMNEVDLKVLINEAVSDLKFLPECSKINFKIDVDNAFIVTDASRIKIVLSNLIGNAIKYYDASKKQNIVELKYKNGGSHWTLEIKDNGIGIEKGRLNRVFEMFYRATESAKGSGLGLYIVKETLERLGGHIAVDSEFGQWTRFVISLPAVDVPEVVESKD